MVRIKKFVFSPFQENTYVLFNNEQECWIIDPGCYSPEEKEELKDFIDTNDLKPVRLLNTHCHLDHVFGNAFVSKTYGLNPEYHQLDQVTLDMAPISAKMYGIPNVEDSPIAKNNLEEGDDLSLGSQAYEIRFCPGHAPGHVVFINHQQKLIIAGDVLFYESIGRTDLPGGDHDTLLESIRVKLFDLDDSYEVYCGHGPETSIGHEKKHNPFVQ